MKIINKQMKQNPMYYYLLILAVATTIGLQSWRTLLNNFAVETVGINGFQMGFLQSVREIPGLLAFLTIYLLLILKEHKLSAISVLLLGIGTAMTGFFPTFYGLLFTTIIMSTGFHYFETTNQSLALQYFSHDHAPHFLSRQKSWMAVANIASGVVVWLLASFLKTDHIFFVCGIAIIACAVWAFLKNPTKTDMPLQQQKIVLKKKYWLFYVLNFFSGARRQIFMAFAAFLMVSKYQYSVKDIAILFIANNILNYYIAPYIGKGIHKYGEKKMLSLEYIGLFFIFLGYAFIENAHIAAVLYILDHIFFNFYIGVKTFFQKTADKEDIAPSMAIGFTINHISAVVIPTIGGALWMISYRIPFLCGAVLCLLSLIFVQMIRYDKK